MSQRVPFLSVLSLILVLLLLFCSCNSGLSASSLPTSSTESKPSSTVTSVPTRSEPETSSVPESTSSLTSWQKDRLENLPMGAVSAIINEDGGITYIYDDSTLPPEEYWRPGRIYFSQEYWNNPVEPDLSALKGETISQISAGNTRTYLLTESGRLFVCGYSELNTFAKDEYKPILGLTEIDLPEPIKLFSSKRECVAAVGESNTIYVWGYWTDRVYDQLEKNYDLSTDIVTVPFEKEIKEVWFSGTRVLLLTNSGEVYAFGDSFVPYGATDFTGVYDGYQWTKEKFLVPQQILTPEPIVQITSTAGSFFLLGKSGTCYAGYDTNVLRFPSSECPSNPHLRVLTFSKPIQSIGTIGYALAVLTKSGEVYGAGEGTALGIGTKETSGNVDTTYPDKLAWYVKEFAKIPVPEKVTALGNATYGIGLFLTESGKIYATGYNHQDWLLTGRDIPPDSEYNEETLTEPVLMQIPDAVEEFSGTGPATFYRRADGKVFFVGSATYGNGLAVDLPDKLDSVFVQRTPVEVPLTFSENCRFN